jgi:hypothetical protein
MTYEWPIVTSTRNGSTRWLRSVDGTSWVSSGYMNNRQLNRAGLSFLDESEAFEHEEPEQIVALYEAIIAQQIEDL